MMAVRRKMETICGDEIIWKIHLAVRKTSLKWMNRLEIVRSFFEGASMTYLQKHTYYKILSILENGRVLFSRIHPPVINSRQVRE